MPTYLPTTLSTSSDKQQLPISQEDAMLNANISAHHPLHVVGQTAAPHLPRRRHAQCQHICPPPSPRRRTNSSSPSPKKTPCSMPTYLPTTLPTSSDKQQLPISQEDAMPNANISAHHPPHVVGQTAAPHLPRRRHAQCQHICAPPSPRRRTNSSSPSPKKTPCPMPTYL